MHFSPNNIFLMIKSPLLFTIFGELYMKKQCLYRCAAIAAATVLGLLWSSASWAQNDNRAQTPTKPRVSFGIVAPTGAYPMLETALKHALLANSGDTVPTILMRERAISLTRRDTAFQTGSIAINRIGGEREQLLVVAYSMEYLDSALRPLPDVGAQVLPLPIPLPSGAIVTPPFPASLPVAINGLQGDLSPTSADANGQLVPIRATLPNLPNTANILPGQDRVLLNFTARWSDQSFSPRSAGLQGRRYVRLTLLRVNDLNYEVGVTLATVILDDPQRVGPVLVNAIQNKQLLRDASDLIELETPGFRSDGLPNSVFYDENYNVLTYTARSSDSTIIRVVARQSDERVGGRPSLFYAVQPGAPLNAVVTITLIADDGTGLFAQDRFDIQVVSTITSARSNDNATPVSIAPNPTADHFFIDGVARGSGNLNIRLVNALGMEVLSQRQPVVSGAAYRSVVDMANLPPGLYMVELQDGGERTTRKVVKN
jgi:hypothetical protein